MQRGFFIAAALCGCSQPSPAPWTSGSDVRAQVYVADGLSVFAGRKNTTLDFRCAVDPTSVPHLKDCPTGAWLLYRNTDCTQNDLGLGMDEEITQYAVDPQGHYYQKTGDYSGFAVSLAPDSTCTIPNGARVWPVLAPFDPAPLHLATPTKHSAGNVHYTSLDSDDGFSVIVDVDDATEVVDHTGARLRARYLERGGVRKYLGVFDAQLNTNCNIEADPSGQLRCVSGGDHAHVTADPTCHDFVSVVYSTSPTVLAHHVDSSLPSHPPMPSKLIQVLGCVPTTQQLYQGIPGTGCFPITTPYLACTEQLSFDMFEAVTLMTE